ncbi:MAG: hypothetical protein JWO67_6119 [Streptosporangiaceae bacterium]|nr:hypothetical protein [Streptosporangiaceae bacterium]
MEIVIRAAVIYLFLFGMTRALGKAALGQLSAFELVTLVVIGDLIQPAVLQDDESLVGAMLAVSTFAVLTVLFAWLPDRFPHARKLIQGQPVVVVRNGEMQRGAMKLERLSRTELLQAAREAGIRDLGDVELAVAEVDGKISFFTATVGESSPAL